MNIRKTVLAAIMATATIGTQAQDITASQTTVDMGRVLYRQPATATFELKNDGKATATIDEVKTNCGCTAAETAATTVAAGKSFIINVTYDAKQLGHFDKQVALFTNGNQQPLILHMRGVVVSPNDNGAVDYSHKLGILHAEKDNVEFDDVNRGDQPMQQIRIQNNSDDTVEPVVMHLPNYLSATVTPQKIAPGRTGVVTITLDSHRLHDYGLTQTSVFLGAFPGDKVSEDKEIAVSAVLLPDNQSLTMEQRLNAPLMTLSKEKVNLGAFGKKSKLKSELTITNNGKSTLDIRSLQMFTTGLDLSLSSKRIAPGQTATLKITAHRSQLMKAKVQPRILMITNDPDHPKVVITVEYE